jgi:serine/threonine-protein kinase
MMGELLGIVIADRYELTGVLGHGGQGVVYRARDRTAGRDVAIKMLSDSVADDPVYAARLAREQEALVALAGSSAVAVYDLCEAPNGSLCLVMELLEGTDLEKHLSELEARDERLPLARLSAIVEPIVQTLERAHDAGIIHRDLKPGNIFLLDDDHGVRLFDFGLSRSKKAIRLTQAGTVMGSPSYIAPEVWKGDSDALDGRVDVYSLGVILFRTLSGKLPFEGATLKESFELASSAPRPSLRALRPDLSPRVDAWVQQGLAINRDKRYQTVRGLWNGLLKALEYQPPPLTMRPVADSLIGAWKAATGAFRRLVDRATEAIPTAKEPTEPPDSMRPPAREVAAVDEAWVELTEADVIPSKAQNRERTVPPPRRRRQDSLPAGGTPSASPPKESVPAAPEKSPEPALLVASPDAGASEHPDEHMDRPSFYSTTDAVHTFLQESAPPATPTRAPSTRPKAEKTDKASTKLREKKKKQKRRKRTNARTQAQDKEDKKKSST